MAHLLIIGAGYTGIRLAERALEANYRVTGTTRSPEKARELQALGAAALILDTEEDGLSALESSIDSSTHVVYSLPTLRKEVDSDAHLDVPRAALALCTRNNARQFVYLSSTSVYGDHRGARVDEDSARNPESPYGVMRRDIEDAVLGADALNTAVVRIAGIYGPGRTLIDYVKKGRYKVVNPDKVTNRIHVDDLVSIILGVLSSQPASSVFLASDGNPARVGDLVDFLVERGMPEPETTTLEAYARERGPNAAARWKTTTRCDPSRTLEELDVELSYPDVFAFYRALPTHALDQKSG